MSDASLGGKRKIYKVKGYNAIGEEVFSAKNAEYNDEKHTIEICTDDCEGYESLKKGESFEIRAEMNKMAYKFKDVVFNEHAGDYLYFDNAHAKLA